MHFNVNAGNHSTVPYARIGGAPSLDALEAGMANPAHTGGVMHSGTPFVPAVEAKLSASRRSPDTTQAAYDALRELAPGSSLQQILPVASRRELNALATLHRAKLIDLADVSFHNKNGEQATAIEFLLDFGFAGHQAEVNELTRQLVQLQHGQPDLLGQLHPATMLPSGPPISLAEQLQAMRDLGVPLTRDKANRGELFTMAAHTGAEAPQVFRFLMEAGLNIHTRDTKGMTGLDVALRTNSLEIANAIFDHSLASNQPLAAVKVALHFDSAALLDRLATYGIEHPRQLNDAFWHCDLQPTTGDHAARFIGQNQVLAHRLLGLAVQTQNLEGAGFVKSALLGHDQTVDAQKIVFDALKKAIESKQPQLVDVLLKHGDDRNPPTSLKLTSGNALHGALNNLTDLLAAAHVNKVKGDSEICRNLLSYGHERQLYRLHEGQFVPIQDQPPNINLLPEIQGRPFSPHRLTVRDVLSGYGRTGFTAAAMIGAGTLTPEILHNLQPTDTPSDAMSPLARKREETNAVATNVVMATIGLAGITTVGLIVLETKRLYREYCHGDDPTFKAALVNTLQDIQNQQP